MEGVTLLSSQELLASPRGSFVIERFQTPDGVVERPLVHHPGSVAILARPDPGSVLLVRQYRYAIRAWTLEIPAGTCLAGEDPLQTAQRELAEETGRQAARWQVWLRVHPCLGLVDEVMTIFLASGLTPTPARPDQGELIAPLAMPVSELTALVANGQVLDAKTLLVVAALGRLPEVGPC